MDRLTKLQIIEETVAYYSEDPSRRAVIFTEQMPDRCAYKTEDGRKCALGRCFVEDAEAFTVEGDAYDVFRNGVYSSDAIANYPLQEKYWGHHIRFWQRLQILHDKDSYWTKTGLSPEGEKEVERLKSDFKD